MGDTLGGDGTIATTDGVTTDDSASGDAEGDGTVPSGQACGDGLPACPSDKPVCESVYKVCVACEVRSSCGPDARCNDRWECEPEERCITDIECRGSPNGPYCLPGRKVCGQCMTQYQCAEGTRCFAGRCEPATPCTGFFEEVCPADRPLCAHDRCQQCVLEDSYCSEPDICSYGTCVAPPPVPSQTSCVDDSACLGYGVPCDVADGHCAACLADADCPATRYCDLATGACRRDECNVDETRCAAWCADIWLPAHRNLVGDPDSFPIHCPYVGDLYDFPGLTAVESCLANGSGWTFSEVCDVEESKEYCRRGACQSVNLLGDTTMCKVMAEKPICTTPVTFATCEIFGDGGGAITNHACPYLHYCQDGECVRYIPPEAP